MKSMSKTDCSFSELSDNTNDFSWYLSIQNKVVFNLGEMRKSRRRIKLFLFFQRT